MTDGGGGSPGVPEGDGALDEVLDEAPSGLADIRMVRADPAPWGFRLMGGRDYSHPLTVTRVLGCSIAEHANLKVGDVVVCVNGAPVRGATHREAQEAVRAAGDSLTLSVIRGSIVMPPPLDVDGVPLIQPPLAHEPIPVPEGSEAPVDQQPAEDQGPGAEGGPEPEDGVVEDASEAAPADSEAQGDVQDAGAEEAGEDENAEDEEEEEEESDEEEDEDEEERRERLDKLDGIRSPRSRMSRSPGPDDILRMQEKALARMEKARARKDRPPTVFLLPPDRPIIRQSRQPRPRPPDPPFKKLVHERIRRRKWAEDHPGEEYPFADDDGRTPTPDSEMTTRATMTPTPTFSDGVDLDMTSELVDQDDLGATEDAASFGGRSGRSSALRDDGTVSQASMRRTPDDDLQEREEEKEEEEEPELAELRRREEEERLAEEARLAAEREAAERAERERLAAEARAERERREAVERKELEAKVAKAAKFKTDVPEFIHEMTEKLSLERPSFPLTPLPRPIVLPGGRKWRTVADAFNEDFIAETLTSQAEVLLGKALGNRRLSNTFPALIHERAEINESCYGCGRINFHKYSHKHDNLKNSAVYRMVHGLDDQPSLPVTERPEKMKAIDDYYQAAVRQSATPSPMCELEPVPKEVKPGTVS